MYKSVLKRTNLFDVCSDAELSAINDHVTKIEYPAGSTILHEDETGDELYIILNGTVSIFKKGGTGQDIVLSKKSERQYFGEQAVLPGGDNRRTVSVSATTDDVLLRIAKEDFQAVLSQDNPLKERVRELGHEQTTAMLIRQSALFRSIPFEDFVDGLYTEVSCTGRDIIFREGEPGDYLYFIVAGMVNIYREEAGGERLLAQLSAGQCFGELALLENDPREVTAIAENEVTLLRVDGEKFVQLYEKTPDLQEYMHTLQRAYLIQGRGFVTQHSGTFLGMDAVMTVFRLLDGSTAVASMVIGQHIFNMSFKDVDEDEAETVCYRDEKTTIERELALVDKQIVSVNSKGIWPELGLVHHLVLERIALSAPQLESFTQTGSFDLEQNSVDDDDEDIICHCLQITRKTLRAALEHGTGTAETLSKTTGAGTVCGSCMVHVREMAGDAQWTSVCVSKVLRVTDNIRSFRFKPLAAMDFQPTFAGQYVVVQAKIGSHWTERPYTLSSACNETRHREITVKRVPDGLFSNWLFDERRSFSTIRLSDPQGHYYVNVDTQKQPLVFFVAGIGMTPALATARSILSKQSGQLLHIDYTASSAKDFAYREELQAMTDGEPSISIKFRETRQDGRVTLKDVQQLVKRYPNAVFYICGPRGYQHAVQLYLTQCHVHAGRINVEEFISPGQHHANAMRPKTGLIQRLSNGKAYIFLGLLLCIAFFMQNIFQLKFEWFEVLQQGEQYKRWTGWLFAGYIGYQWFLPLLRLLGRTQEHITIQHYHLHKLAGVLAPVVFYIHSTKFGYAYVCMLSMMYFANSLLGYLNKDIIADTAQQQRYGFYWMIGHVSASVLTLVLVLYHMYIVYAYQ